MHHLPALPLSLVLCSAFHRPLGSWCWWLQSDWGNIDKSYADQVLHREKYSAGVDGFFFLAVISVWGCFHTLHIVLSSLISKSTLNLILLCMVCFTCVRCFFSVLALLDIPNASEAHLHVCTLSGRRWVGCSRGVSSVQSVSCPLSPSPEHLSTTSRVPASQHLCYHTSPVLLHASLW